MSRLLVVGVIAAAVLAGCGSTSPGAPPGSRQSLTARGPGSTGAVGLPDVEHPALLTQPPAGTRDGDLVALDERSGKVRWRQRLPAAQGYPIADGDVVLVAGSYGPVGAVVVALSSDSGAPLWRWPRAGWLHDASYAANWVTVTHGVVTVGMAGGITVLDERTGQRLWSRAGGNDAATTHGAVVVADPETPSTRDLRATRRLAGLKPMTGGPLWTTGPVLRDVFAPVGSRDAVLALFHAGAVGAALAVVSVSTATGREQWSSTIDGSFDGGYLPVAGPIDLVSLTREDGDTLASTWIALDVATGKQLWRNDLPDSCGQPAMADGQVYAGSEGGTVLAGNETAGGEVWRRNLHASLRNGGVPTLAAGDGLVIIPTSDGVAALSAQTGGDAWSAPLTSTGDIGADHVGLANGQVYVVMGGASVPNEQ